MKKLMYLFVASIILALTACGGGGETATEEAVPASDEAVVEDVAPVEEVEDTTTEEAEDTEDATEEAAE